MDVYKQLGLDPKTVRPGDLLKARSKMTKAYLDKERAEHARIQTAKERAHEKRESKIHEIAEHLTKEQVEALKKLTTGKKLSKSTKVKIMTLI